MNTASSTGRCLTIQSHVVSGYVGNKCAVFPLQLHGFDVDPILSVQFSNHTGYGSWKGEVMTGEQLQSIVEGLESNGLLEGYTHVLTGYMRQRVDAAHGREACAPLRALNPALVYVCDPVLGDNGKLYVPAELVGIYRDDIVPLATMLTPNQFEAELLTGVTIATESDALGACQALHEAGPASVVLTPLDLEEDADEPTDGGTRRTTRRRAGESPPPIAPVAHHAAGKHVHAATRGMLEAVQDRRASHPELLHGNRRLVRGAAAGVEREDPGPARERRRDPPSPRFRACCGARAAAQAEAEASGKSGIGCRELRLVQSVDELLRPEVDEGARVAWLE